MKKLMTFLFGFALLVPMGPAAADLNDGLVGHWPFDGNANDATGNGHDGTVSGPMLTTDRYGNANSAYAFNGWGQIIVPHHPQLNVAGNATYTAWVQRLEASPGYWSYGESILAKGYPNGYWLYVYYGNILFYNAAGGGYSVQVSWEQWYQEWHHIAVVVDSASGLMSTYVDGVFISSSYTSFAANNSTEPLTIGDPYGYYGLNGKLDDIRIYDRALSAAEISELVNDNTAPDVTGAVASTGSLWPPNNKMVDISIEGVTDADGDEVTITIDNISDDEGSDPDNAIANGDTASLRAQRDGSGDGRIYAIEFTADDGNGGVSTGSVTVEVPHDQSDGQKKGRGKLTTGAEATSWGAIKKSMD